MQVRKERKEIVAWLLVCIWTALIFAGIPVARSIQGFVEASFGRAFFLVIVFSVLIAAFSFCMIKLSRGVGPRICLSAVSLVYAVWTWQLRANPEEAFHFVEYGVLSVLAYQALSIRFEGALVFVCASLICSIIGNSDEVVQWLVPSRTFDFRDVWLNAAAGMLIQVAIALGIRPVHSLNKCDGSPKILLRILLSVQLLLLALCFSNTPAVVRFYSSRLSFLSYVMGKENMMAEYGYRHAIPEGSFFSRFDLDELAMIDSERAPETASVLRSLRGGRPYLELLRMYSPFTDPFTHEALVHLFRRDEYIGRGLKGVSEPCSISFHEEAVLEKYFPKTLLHSGLGLEPEIRKALSGCANRAGEYVSPVSANLITEFSVRDVWLSFFGLMVVVWFPRRRV